MLTFFCGLFFQNLENIRKVTVVKTAQGLGLSVTGGVASSPTPGTSGFSSPSTLDAAFVTCSWPGLIRIKKIFLHGAAWQTGQLAVGDVLLAANGQPLTGCTNYVSSGFLLYVRLLVILLCQLALEFNFQVWMKRSSRMQGKLPSMNNGCVSSSIRQVEVGLSVVVFRKLSIW